MPGLKYAGLPVFRRKVEKRSQLGNAMAEKGLSGPSPNSQASGYL
jgi:hypothetical protein